MKIKRFLAGLLALSMVFGTGNLTNVSAAETTDGSELLAEGLTDGTYTDETADADTEYEYTVVGSDGSVSTISTDLTDIVGKVYEKHTGTGAPPAGNYVIATAARITGSAIGNTTTDNGNLIMKKMDIIDDRIRDVEDAYVWNLEITDTDNGYYSISNVGKASANESSYLELKNPSSANGLGFNSASSDWKFTYAEATENSWAIGNTGSTGFINSHKDSWTDSTRGAGTYSSGTGDAGSRFYLFGEKYYTVQEDAIEELTANVGDRNNYSEESWEVYTEALVDARDAYNTQEEVLPVYEALEAAVDGLVPMVWFDVVEGSYYQKVTSYSSSGQPVSDGVYLIVGAHTVNENQALAADANLTYTGVSAADDKITPINEALEWQFTWNESESGYTIEAVDYPGAYVHINNEDSVTGAEMRTTDSPQVMKLAHIGESDYQNSVHIGGINTDGTTTTVGYLNHRNGAIGTWNGSNGTFPDNGSSLYLYKKIYGISAAKISEAITGVGEESAYTADSWTTYDDALTAANGGFDSVEEAYIAYIDLLEAVNDLVAIDIPDYITEVYVKISPDFDKENPVEDGTYVIVGANVGYSANKLVNSAEHADGGLTYTSNGLTFTMNNTRVSPLSDVYEWKFISTADGVYMVVAADDGSYMSVTDSGVSLSADAVDIKIIAPKTGSAYATTGAMCIGNGTWWLNHQNDVVKTWSDNDGGSSYYLYERVFIVDSTKLDEITAGVGEESTYTTESWTAYSNALTAAQGEFATADAAYAAYTALEAAKDGLDEANYSYTMKELYDAICAANGGEFLFSEEVYTSESGKAYREALEAARGTFTTEAEKVQALENLVDAVEALELNTGMKSVFPETTWTVTAETDSEDTTTGKNYIQDLVYTNTEVYDPDTSDTDGVTFAANEALIWNWESIARLVNDEDQKTQPVWTTNELGLSHRVFSHSVRDNNAYEKADVYKISGSFEWPEGYELANTTVVLDSVNDFYYRDVYEYIDEQKLGDYFPLGQVLPVDDDVYVVLWAEENGETKPAVDDMNNHLAFWAGTSGKGVWSENGNINNDWGRTETATFLEWNLQGERTFRNSYPNIIGTTAIEDTTEAKETANAGVEPWNFEYLQHTDGWYTLTDTSAINSVLRDNYPNGITAGTIVHVDLYVMNNSGKGAIDEFEIELYTTEDPDVEVNYYLNTVSDDTLLGTEYMLNVPVGTEVTLMPGVRAGQLNSYKAEAIYQAGYKDVTDGVQQGTIPYVVEAENNVINVVYTVKDAEIVYLQADSGEIPYDGVEHTLDKVSITEAGYDNVVVNTPSDASTGSYTLPDSNTIENVYSVVSATEPGIYANNFKTSDGTTPIIAVKDAETDAAITESYAIIKTPGTLKITTNTVEETYTYDFGVTNSYTNVLKTDATANVAEECADAVTADKDNVTFDITTNTLTYTPSSVNTGETVTLTLTYKGDGTENYTVEKIVNFVPASNVFYEENFAAITGDGDDATAASWTTDGTAGSKTVTDNDSTEYGYAKAYDTVETHSNSSALKATLGLTDGTGISGTTAKTLDAVTFTFTGTGFDLISKCGTDTGMLLVKVVGADTGTTKAYLVDTYFTGDGEYIASDSAAAYQVPVIREMDLTYDTYTVTVYGYLVNTAGAMTATYSMDDSASAVPVEDILMIALEDCGMSDIDTSEVEVTYMDDNSVLNGGTGNVYADSGIGTFALDAADESSDTTEGTDTATTDTAYVYVDGFRVYQPLTDETAYTEDEKGVKYASLFEFVQTSANDLSILSDNTAVYIEYDGATDVSAIADYKNQGPENEVYLSPKSAIAFVVDNYAEGDTIQVSAKAVTNGGTMTYTTGTDDNLNYVPLSVSTTEMYYTVEAAYDSILGEYYVQITNDGNTGVLAISGVKLKSTIQPMASASAGEVIVENMNADASKFAPEKMTISVPEEVTVGRTFSISVSTSLEVDHLAIDFGDGEGKQTLNATNTKAVKAKRAKVYKFSTAYCELETGTYTYTLYAYDADGNESAPVEVTVKVVEQQ